MGTLYDPDDLNSGTEFITKHKCFSLWIFENDITSSIIDAQSSPPIKPERTSDQTFDGFSSNDVSRFATNSGGKFVMYQLDSTKQIEKILVRVYPLKGISKTLFSKVTIEIGLTADSLTEFDTYMEKSPPIGTVVTFFGQVEGKFIKISSTSGVMVIAEVVIVGN